MQDVSFFRYLQQGSFPVISPLNESFPEFFNTIRTDLHSVSVLTDNEVKDYSVYSPLPGSWYGVAYLGDFIDDSIRQQVTAQSNYKSSECHLSLMPDLMICFSTQKIITLFSRVTF